MAQIVAAVCAKVPEHSVFLRFHANGSLAPDILCPNTKESSYSGRKYNPGVICELRGNNCYFAKCQLQWVNGEIGK